MSISLHNNHILKKSFGAFFIASILTNVISQVNNMVDGFIVGNMISPDALSVYTLGGPLLMVIGLFHSVLVSGAALLVTKEIGNLNYSKASKIFTLCLYCIATLFVVICFGVSIFSDNIAEFLTNDDRLLPMLKEYLPICILTQPFIVLVMTANMFVEMAGRPKLVTASVLIVCLTNIPLDLLFVGPMNMGIRGAVLATALSFILSFIVCVPYLHSKDCIYHLVLPKRKWTYPLFLNTCSMGVPSLAGSVAFAVFSYLFNYIVQGHFGANGMFVLSVLMQILSLSNLAMTGVSKCINGVGGVLLGEKDIDGYRTLTTSILKYAPVVVAALCLFFSTFPQIPAKIFGATDEMLPDVILPLRQSFLMLLPLSIINLLSENYMVLGHKKISTLTSTSSLIFTLPTIWIVSELYPDFFWLSISVSLFVALAAVILLAIKTSRKDNSVHPLTLIPKYPNDPFIAVSMSRSVETMKRDLTPIIKFLRIIELPKNTYYDIAHCIEEMSFNIISHTEKSRENNKFDIRVTDEIDKVSVNIKDDGIPFNPIYKFDPSVGGGIADDEHIGLAIVNHMCNDIQYSYRNGINCVSLTFPVPDRTSL